MRQTTRELAENSRPFQGLKFLVMIGRHVPTKGSLKTYYFMASIFVQIGLPNLPCARTSEH